MSATYDRTDDYTVCISDRGMGLWRAEADNEIMRNLRRTPKLHTAGVVIGGIGLVICLCVLFARAVLGNS
jgi:hypothetical protein